MPVWVFIIGAVLIASIHTFSIIIKHKKEIKKEPPTTEFNVVFRFDDEYYLLLDCEEKEYYFPTITIEKQKQDISYCEINNEIVKQFGRVLNLDINDLNKCKYSKEKVLINKTAKEYKQLYVLFLSKEVKNKLGNSVTQFNDYSAVKESCAAIIKGKEKKQTHAIIRNVVFFILYFLLLIILAWRSPKDSINSSAIDFLSFFIALLFLILNTAYEIYCSKTNNRKIDHEWFVYMLPVVLSVLIIIFESVQKYIAKLSFNTSAFSLIAILLGLANFIPIFIIKKMKYK